MVGEARAGRRACLVIKADVCVRGGFLHSRGHDPVLAILLFAGALALHSRQLDLKLRLDYLWATQVSPRALNK